MKPVKNTICRLCLRDNTNVYKIGNSHYKDLLSSLFKLEELKTVPSENHYICYMCVALLSKLSNFIQMIFNAQKLIYDILKTNDSVGKDLLTNINRPKHGLNLFELSFVRTDTFERIYDSNFKDHNPVTKGADILCIDVSSSSDEEIKEQCNFNVGEIELHNPVDVNNKILKNKNRKDHGLIEITEAKSKSLKSKTKKKKTEKPIHRFSSEFDSSSSSELKPTEKRKMEDIDYEPDSTSHSEDSDFDSYDDMGKRIKRPKDGRIYPRQCDHCNYEVPKRGDHYRHYLFQHPNIQYPYMLKKTYACYICGKLMTKFKIKGHEQSHTNMRVKCPVCRKEFSSLNRMLSHKYCVHPRKTYTCDYCSKIFKTRSDITRHLRIHDGIKPYKCHICDAAFAHSGNRIIHIRSAHQNFKYVPKKKNQIKKLLKKRYSNLKSGDEEKRKNNKRRKIEHDDHYDREINLEGKKRLRITKKHKKKSSEYEKSNVTNNCDASDCTNTETKQDAETDSDDENLAVKKEKKKLQNDTKVKYSVGETESDDESLAQKKIKNIKH